MKNFDGPIHKPSDNFAYKDDQEKEDLQDQVRSAKLQLEVKLGSILLGGMLLFGVGYLLYSYFTNLH